MNHEMSSASLFSAEEIFLLIQHTRNRHFQLQLLYMNLLLSAVLSSRASSSPGCVQLFLLHANTHPRNLAAAELLHRVQLWKEKHPACN